MNVYQFRCNIKHLSTKIIIVDAEGHEVFCNNLGTYIHWIRKEIYDSREIDYVYPEDDNMLIIYLED